MLLFKSYIMWALLNELKLLVLDIWHSYKALGYVSDLCSNFKIGRSNRFNPQHVYMEENKYLYSMMKDSCIYNEEKCGNPSSSLFYDFIPYKIY